ncbi:MAG: hypothetical protein ACRENG_03640 [bacterium]
MKNRRFTLTRPLCSQCVKLPEEVKRLRERINALEAQLRYQQRKIDEGYFGSSTPSSKRPFKVGAKAAHHNGGAPQGHQGHGRAAISAQEADAVLPIDTEHICPDCQVPLVSLDSRDRTVARGHGALSAPSHARAFGHAFGHQPRHLDRRHASFGATLSSGTATTHRRISSSLSETRR